MDPERKASTQVKITITKTNFAASDSSRRPAGWIELRLKRVMLKEHIDRIAGIDEESIMDLRSDREIKEEALMVDEVLCLGRVLDVGESSRGLIPQVPVVVVSPETFDPLDTSKRPLGWVEARAKRVLIKDQADRFRGVPEEYILHNRPKREQEVRTLLSVPLSAQVDTQEERLMLEEVATYGHLVGVGGPVSDTDLPLQVPVLEFTAENFDPAFPSKRPQGWVAARKKRVYRKEQIDRLRGVPQSTVEEMRRQREIDVRLYPLTLC